VRARLLAVILAAAAAAAVAACERIDRNMWDNPAFRPQEEPVRLPPKESIPTKGIERIPSLAEGGRLANPVKPTDGDLLKGKELFNIHCAPCHGESGAGDGPVGKKYVPTPADLRAGSRAAKRSDGELFVIVSGGLGGMPAFRADLSSADRWRTIAHMRTLK
jgi:mono/diheme cytochrome c family protein